MRVQNSKVVRSLCLFVVVIAICMTTGCATSRPSTLQYLKTLESSHELDAKAVRACTQGYTPKPKLLAAKNSTLRAVRKIMLGSPELKRDSILNSDRQGYAAICISKTRDYGKPVTVGDYHLSPPNDGSGGGGDGGGILEW